MRIAVTAASGRLGHALLRLLAGDGAVVAVARDPGRVQVPSIERVLATTGPWTACGRLSVASTRPS